MTHLRRSAIFDLCTAVLAAILVLTLFLWKRDALVAQSGFATLALIGFRHMRNRNSLVDERDSAIHRQSALVAYVALWLGLVAWGVAIPMRYADAGAVPIMWVAPVIWVAAWLVITTRSLSVLVLDSRGL